MIRGRGSRSLPPRRCAAADGKGRAQGLGRGYGEDEFCAARAIFSRNVEKFVAGVAHLNRIDSPLSE